MTKIISMPDSGELEEIRRRIDDLTGSTAGTIGEALDQWDNERAAVSLFYEQTADLQQIIERYRRAWDTVQSWFWPGVRAPKLGSQMRDMRQAKAEEIITLIEAVAALNKVDNAADDAITESGSAKKEFEQEFQGLPLFNMLEQKAAAPKKIPCYCEFHEADMIKFDPECPKHKVDKPKEDQ